MAACGSAVSTPMNVARQQECDNSSYLLGDEVLLREWLFDQGSRSARGCSVKRIAPFSSDQAAETRLHICTGDFTRHFSKPSDIRSPQSASPRAQAQPTMRRLRDIRRHLLHLQDPSIMNSYHGTDCFQMAAHAYRRPARESTPGAAVTSQT